MAGVASVGGVAIPTSMGSVRAAESVTFSGTFESYNGDPIAGRKIYVSNAGGKEYIETTSEGLLETTVDANSRVYLGLYKSGRQLLAPVRNGVPHIDGLGSYSVGSQDKDIGEFIVDRAYLVTLRALKSDGTPSTNAEFGFGADGYGSGGLPPADDEGYLVLNRADFQGIELAESANVSIRIPNDDGDEQRYEKTLFVDSPMTITAQLGAGVKVTEHTATSTPATTTTTTTTSTTTSTTTTQTTTSPPTTDTKTPTESPTTRTTTKTTATTSTSTEDNSNSTRGFFSNEDQSDDIEILTNPFFLTVGGFLLSVAGIGLNLIRGK